MICATVTWSIKCNTCGKTEVVPQDDFFPTAGVHTEYYDLCREFEKVVTGKCWKIKEHRDYDDFFCPCCVKEDKKKKKEAEERAEYERLQYLANKYGNESIWK